MEVVLHSAQYTACNCFMSHLVLPYITTGLQCRIVVLMMLHCAEMKSKSVSLLSESFQTWVQGPPGVLEGFPLPGLS